MTARTDMRKYYPGVALIAEPHWLDSEDLEFGDDADVTMSWDGTNLNILPATDDQGQVRIGNGTLDMDFRVTLGTAAAYVQFDVGNVRVDFEGVDLRVMDGDFLQFGDDADVGISWDGGSLNILPLTDNVGIIEIGNGTLDIDVQIFMNTAAQSVLFDVDASRVIFEGTDLRLNDTDILEFGDDADVTMTWDGNSLNILPLGDDTGRIEIGDGATDMDLIVFLGDAGQSVLFDVGNVCVTLTNVSLNLAGTFTATPLFFDTVVLPADTNVIRGVGLSPTRTSGWVAFQGSIENTPAVCYPLFLQLDTTGVAEILGIGIFMDMSAGASCKTLWGAQFSASVASGATVLTAAGAPTIGVFAITAKTTINTGSTFNAGGVVAAIMLSVQANTVDVSGENSSIFNLEIASGRLRAVTYLKATGGAGATYLYEIADDIGEPGQSNSGSVANVGTSGWLKVKVGANVRYIPLGDGVA